MTMEHLMSRRFKQWAANVEVVLVAGLLAALAIAYVVSHIVGASPN